MPLSPGSPAFNRALAAFAEVRRRTFYPKTDLEIPPAALAAARSRLETEMPKLVRQCQTLFPGPVLHVEPLAGAGTFHLLFRIEFASAEPVYLRAGFVFRNRPNFEFLLEEQLHAKLRARGIPVPEVLRTDFSRREFPLDYQIIAEARGRPLNTLERAEDQFLPDEVLADVGRSMAQWHRIEASGAGLLDPAALSESIEGVLPDWEEYLMLHLDEHVRTCMEAGAVSPAEGSEIIALFERHSARLSDSPRRLLHGDPGHHNVFVHEHRVSAVIDWEDALAGDPIFDVAYWGTFVRDYLREPFLRGYREVEPLPKDFELRYWLYYLRVALSKTVHRFLFGYPDRPGRPPASRRIQKALSQLAGLA